MNALRLLPAVALLTSLSAVAATIPATNGTALDGRTITLPQDLAPRATVLILGFGRNSATATTAWEQRIRAELASSSIGFYDMPMLAEVPTLVRPMVLRSIRRQVPDIVKARFLPITTGLAAWKQAANFADSTPDAAYVLLVDARGNILWQTHDPLSSERFTELAGVARKLAQ